MWLHASCALSFDVEIPTPMVLMLRPRSGAHQWIASEDYRITPVTPVVEFTDKFGNLCQRLIAPPGPFHLHSSADVLLPDAVPRIRNAAFIEVQNLPDAVLEFLLPSRYCEADRMTGLAHEIVGMTEPGYPQVAAISRWIRATIRYEPGSSNTPISALEVLDKRTGVCRDLAHVGIALCRSLCIPARLVVGYLHGLEPMDVHAWFEVYVGDRWHAFDSTQSRLRGGRIAIAYGRDATDVAIYNQYGPLLLPNSIDVVVERLQRTA